MRWMVLLLWPGQASLLALRMWWQKCWPKMQHSTVAAASITVDEWLVTVIRAVYEGVTTVVKWRMEEAIVPKWKFDVNRGLIGSPWWSIEWMHYQPTPLAPKWASNPNEKTCTVNIALTVPDKRLVSTEEQWSLWWSIRWSSHYSGNLLNDVHFYDQKSSWECIFLTNAGLLVWFCWRHCNTLKLKYWLWHCNTFSLNYYQYSIRILLM